MKAIVYGLTLLCVCAAATALLPGCPIPLRAHIGTSATSGAAPLDIDFRDESTGAVASREWNFGDGSEVSTRQNPSHTYTESGSYDVILTVRDADGATDEDTIEIVVGDPVAPTAAFTASAIWGPVGLTVAFTDLSEAGSSDIETYRWDFDDGDVLSTAGSVQHTFLTAGTFTVELRVHRRTRPPRCRHRDR